MGPVTFSAVPTAHMSDDERASTLVSVFVSPAPDGTGAGTVVQAVPSQCIVVACEPVPSPTTQTSVDDNASMPCSGGPDCTTTSHVGMQSATAATAGCAGPPAVAASRPIAATVRPRRLIQFIEPSPAADTG